MKCKNMKDDICLRSMNIHVARGGEDGDLVRVPIKCPFNCDLQECLDELIDVNVASDVFGTWSAFVLTHIVVEDQEKPEKQVITR